MEQTTNETRPLISPAENPPRPAQERVARGRPTRLRRVEQWLGGFFESGQQKNTIPVLDGVRALACLFVMTFHINWTAYHQQLWQPLSYPIAAAVMLAGGTGVTLFFVLSGFLLFLPYAKALLFPADAALPSARRFYLRRALRILPAYYVSLVLLILFWQPQYLQPAHWKELLLFVTFFMDSAPETFRQINGPYWTLAVEWQFYLWLPLLGLAFYLLIRRVPQRWRLRAVGACLLGLILWALSTRLWGAYFVAHPTESFLVPRPVLNVLLFIFYGSTGKFLEDFAVGMLLATCYVYARRAPESRLIAWLRRRSLWLWGCGILILFAMALWHLNRTIPAFAFLNALAPAYDLLSELCFSLGYGACVAALLFGPEFLRRPFEWRYLRWIGLISYSLYIWHLVIIALFEGAIGSLAGSVHPLLVYGLYWGLALLVIIPFSALSYGLVERPGMRLADRWRGRSGQRPRQEARAGETAEAPAGAPGALSR